MLLNEQRLRTKLSELLIQTKKHFNITIKGLTEDDVNQVIGSGSVKKSVYELIYHIIRVDVYGLTLTGDNTFQRPEEIPLTELLIFGKNIEQYYLEKIQNIEISELNSDEFIFYDGRKIKKQGSFGWALNRVCNHTLYHSAQISLLRYLLDNPAEVVMTRNETSWYWATESIIQLSKQDHFE